MNTNKQKTVEFAVDGIRVDSYLLAEDRLVVPCRISGIGKDLIDNEVSFASNAEELRLMGIGPASKVRITIEVIE